MRIIQRVTGIFVMCAMWIGAVQAQSGQPVLTDYLGSSATALDRVKAEPAVQAYAGPVTVQDSLALVTFYHDTEGAAWSYQENWLTGPVSTWQGVRVKDGRIVALHQQIERVDLVSLTQLTALDSLLLHAPLAGKSGALPEDLQRLAALKYLALWGRGFKGNLAEGMGLFPQLSTLHLEDTQFTGPAGTWLGDLTNLEVIVLHKNGFSGSIGLEMAQLEKLKYLDLSENAFSGNLPDQVIRNWPELEVLRLSNNQFRGSLSPSFADLQKLRVWLLEHNDFEGFAERIPPMDSLRWVDWERNPIGSLFGLGDQPELVYMACGSCDLVKLHRGLGNLKKLRFLDVHNNVFWEVSTDFGEMESLEIANLERNDFILEGLGPLSDLTKLRHLRLDFNQIRGDVTSLLAPLQNLESLQLQNNQINALPDLATYPALQHLSVQNNQFTVTQLENQFLTLPEDATYTYWPQNFLHVPIERMRVNLGKSFTLTAPDQGEHRTYQWTRSTRIVEGATDRTYAVERATMKHFGAYRLEVQHTLLPEVKYEAAAYRVDIRPRVYMPVEDIEAHMAAGEQATLYFRLRNQESVGMSMDFELSGDWMRVPALTKVIPSGTIGFTALTLDTQNLTDGTYEGEVIVRMEGTEPTNIGEELRGTVTVPFVLQVHPKRLGQTVAQDSIALAHFYDFAYGSKWPEHYRQNWLRGPVKEWAGVHVRDGRVVSLSLPDFPQYTQYPPEWGALTHLEALNLDGGEKFAWVLPDTWQNFTNLRWISLAGHGLESLPEWLPAWTSLQYLFLNDNDLETLPANIAEMPNLRSLGVGRNNLNVLPNSIVDMPQLEALNVRENRLIRLPDSLGKITTLTAIDVAHNQLDVLPASFNQLDNLTYIDLSHNQLDSLIADWSDFKVLELAFVQENRLDFGDLEPLIHRFKGRQRDITYSPQQPLFMREEAIGVAGQITLDAGIGGTTNQYQWFREETPIPGANAATYHIEFARAGDAGQYRVDVTNPMAPRLNMQATLNLHVIGNDLAFDEIPETHQLLQNYPNPFNPSTRIIYGLAEEQDVQVAIYDVFGRRAYWSTSENRQGGMGWSLRPLPWRVGPISMP